MTKYENDYHTADHRMAMVQKNAQVGLKNKISWEPLFYIHSQSEFLEKYNNKEDIGSNK
jgi:hypothetical protein